MAGLHARPGFHRVIVTRPEPEATEWVRDLCGHGFDAVALPLIDIASVMGEADLNAVEIARKELHHYRACLFVSSNAVRHFFKQNTSLAQSIRAQAATKNIALPQLTNTNQRFVAPGPGTAAALREAGVPGAQIDSPDSDAAQFDSEALWRKIGTQQWAGQRVLIVRGDSGGELPTNSGGNGSGDSGGSGGSGGSGRDWIAGKWRAAGAEVDFVRVYARMLPRWQAAEHLLAQTALHDGSVWLLSSGEAVKNLRALLPLTCSFAAAQAIATHPRIAAAAQHAGWGVVKASRPALHDLIAALRSIESGKP